MATRTWVGRFVITLGQPQEEGPRLRSFPRQRPDEEDDELYVLVEPTSPAGEEYAGQLVNAIGRGYQGDSLSLTGALLRSLKAAHQQLLQWNQRSLPEQRVGAGVSCLAVRGRVAYLAQVGPIAAYHVGDGQVQRILPDEDATEPLGQPDQLQPDFRRYQLDPGDLLLLASPKIDELLDEQALHSILLRDANEALVELYRLSRDQQQFALVLLACVVEPEGGAASDPVGLPTLQAEDVGPPGASVGAVVPPVVPLGSSAPVVAPEGGIAPPAMPPEGAAPTDAPAEEGTGALDATEEEDIRLAEASLEGEGIPDAEHKEEPTVPEAPGEDDVGPSGAGLADEIPTDTEDEVVAPPQPPLEEAAPPPTAFEEDVAPADEPPVGTAPTDAGEALAPPQKGPAEEGWLPKAETVESEPAETERDQNAPPPLEAAEQTPQPSGGEPEEPTILSDEVASSAAAMDEAPPDAAPPEGLSQPRVRLKGDDANIHYPRTTGLGANLPSIPPRAIAAVLVILVVALLGFFVFRPALEESRVDRFTSLMDEARIALATAENAANPDLRRESLRSADQALLEAAGLQPEEAEVATLRAQVDTALTELDAILELPELELIVDVSERVPGPVSSKGLALGGGGAYLLDGEEDRLIAISLLGPSPVPTDLIREGDPVGSAIVGRPDQITWAEGLQSLLILDHERRLIAVRFGEAPRLLPVRNAQSWDSVAGIAYAGGNLYVLDRDGDQVWRYLGTQSGFDSERESLLPPTDLEQATELAISDDLYLLDDDAILHFRDGTALPFTQAGIDLPLASPASLIPLTGSNRVLVADTGNKRIVVFSSDGVFQQQWKSPVFTDLRALAVDEPNNLLYILVGGALYRTPLPPPLPTP